MLRTAFFDGDGVLVDSEGPFKRAVDKTFEPYGISMGDDEYVSRWVINQTGTRGIIKDYKLGQRGVTPEYIRKRRDEILHQLIDSELKMMSYAGKLLERMDRYPLVLVSSEHRENLKKKLGKFGFWERFAVSVCAGEAKRNKHYPDPWLKAVELLKPELPGLKPEECLVIEDNPVGIKSAKEAGCKTIAFPNGYTRDMEFPGADKIVYNLDKIDENMLRELFHDI